MGKFLVVLTFTSLLTGCVTSGTLKRETQAAFAAGAASRAAEIEQLQLERDANAFVLEKRDKELAAEREASEFLSSIAREALNK